MNLKVKTDPSTLRDIVVFEHLEYIEASPDLDYSESTERFKTEPSKKETNITEWMRAHTNDNCTNRKGDSNPPFSI